VPGDARSAGAGTAHDAAPAPAPSAIAPCRCHFRATGLEESGKSRQDSSSIAQLLGSNGRFDGMRPDYLDREPKATTWAEIIAPPPGTHVSRALRRAFDVPEAAPDEWDKLLARIP